MLSRSDHDRVEAALEHARAGTDAEIWCVVAGESGHYRETPFAAAAAAAFLLPPLILSLGLRPAAVSELVTAAADRGWSLSSAASASSAVWAALAGYAVLQGLVFAAAGGLASLGPVRRALTPRSVKRERVRLAAFEQFAHRLHASGAASGVLVYASIGEREVRIVADETLNAKVESATWSAAVAAAVAGMKRAAAGEGLARAVETCGKALARACPPDGDRSGGGGLVEL